MIVVCATALCACVWIVAWYLGTQAVIAGALVMTLTLVGVLAINWILDR